MVAVGVFSGFVISDCALASAAARAPNSVTGAVHGGLIHQQLKADAADFERFAFKSRPKTSLASSGNELLEFSLGTLVLRIACRVPPLDVRELCSGIGLAHIDDTDGFQAGLGRFDTPKPRLIRAHHASPEGLLGGQNQVLVEGIRPDGRLDCPFLDIVKRQRRCCAHTTFG